LSFNKLVDNKIANNTLAGMVTIGKIINEVADEVCGKDRLREWSPIT